MRLAALLIAALAPGPGAPAQDPPKPAAPAASPEAAAPDNEDAALAFVREHHPELAAVVEALRPMNPAEYRRAIKELGQVARTVGGLRERNPRRYAVALAEWKARSRVELLAARLAAAPGEDKLSELRTAIEAKVDAEAARHRLDLEQAEAAAKRARTALEALEARRDEIVENRLRALKPKKAKAKPKANDAAAASPSRPAPAPAAGSPDTTPGGNRP